jgi:hypothetical protein
MSGMTSVVCVLLSDECGMRAVVCADEQVAQVQERLPLVRILPSHTPWRYSRTTAVRDAEGGDGGGDAGEGDAGGERSDAGGGGREGEGVRAESAESHLAPTRRAWAAALREVSLSCTRALAYTIAY